MNVKPWLPPRCIAFCLTLVAESFRFNGQAYSRVMANNRGTQHRFGVKCWSAWALRLELKNN